MSYRIEYQWICFAIDGDHAPGLITPRWVVAIEGGDSNLYAAGTRGRARDWSLGMIGTSEQVLTQAVRSAAACESGQLKPRGQRCTPEAYIHRIRRLLTRPRRDTLSCIALGAQVLAGHPLVASAADQGFELCPFSQYGQDRVKVLVRPERWAAFFDLVDDAIESGSVMPWQLGEAWLPRS